ncbi:MAG: MarR family winged helix-turn-helix transcriptional regulator [Desulfobacteraceae bacterium]|jgi:DNA-binding MarR family transcriptional regulator
MLDQIQAIRKFNRFYTNFLGLLNETILDSPVTLAEGRILFEIYMLPNCNAKKLIGVLNLDRGYMSRVLKRLERIRLIERVTDPGDKRIRNLKLTKDGKLLMGIIDRDANNHIKGILKGINSAERKMLIKAMGDIEKILANRSIDP